MTKIPHALTHRLRKAWTAFWAADLERVLCGCGQWFYRPICPHPDTKCAACRDTEMDQWIAQIRASVG